MAAPKVGLQEGSDQSPYPRTRKPTVGGTLILLTGVLGFINSVIMIAGARELAQEVQPMSLTPAQIAGAGLVFLVLNLVVMASGIMAVRRRLWALALAGGILGIFVGGFIIGNLLAIAGTIIIAFARREFVGHREYVAERRLTGA